jgi:hypothetical protein
MHEEDQEDEQRSTRPGCPKVERGELVSPQPMSHEEEEADPHREAGGHADRLVFVERGQEKPDDRGDAHEPDRQAPEEGTEADNPVAEEEDGNGSESRGQGRNSSYERDDDDFGHGRPYPV